MSLGLFDVIGPVMHGPSSNHTGGANRIGYVAGRIIGGTARQYTFQFHPLFMRMFTGHRTHIAMLAGCLGMREFDDNCNDSKMMADKMGISVSYLPIEDEEVDRNTMRILADYDGVRWCVNGISIGGGNIIISHINGVATNLDGNCYVYLYLLRTGTLNSQLEQKLKAIAKPARYASGPTDGGGLVCMETREAVDPQSLAELAQLLGDSVVATRQLDPITLFADSTGATPLFSTYAELLELCKDKPLIDVVKAYETRRSGRTAQEVLDQALEIVQVIETSMARGLQGDNPLICGFCTGSDGRMVDVWGKSENSITGGVFNDAMAGALAMAEISASAGRVVAAPTSGSAGGLPGTLFAVAKRFGSSREELANAFLISAAMGVVIGNKCTFSGSIGGCQSEIGVGAGMAAAGACYLAGGSAEASVHATALAIKNTLGLVCDPPASPVEVPCIKRNAMGAAVALMAAELALAGVRSAVPADDVVVALKDTQDRLPTELRAACVGGLAAAPCAKDMQSFWQKRLEELNEGSEAHAEATSV